MSSLNQREDKFEFKFTYVTHRSLRFYKEIISILKQSSGWSFEFIFKKKESAWSKTTFWKEYLIGINLLVNKFPGGDLVLVSDYLSKPKSEEDDLFSIIEKESSVLNILQLESQGSLLLQVADILLGGVAYQKRIQDGFKTDDLKRELSDLVVELLNNKNKKEQL